MKNYFKWVRLSSFLCLIIFLCGCDHVLDTLELRDETVYPPAKPIDNRPPPKSNGTIYQSGHEISLYEDHIAHRVGDLLTVKLEESTEGHKQAKTKANKTTTDSTNKGSQPQPELLGVQLGKFIFDTGTDLEFDGKGETNQFNKLNGMVTVTVTEVLSNNNLAVQGETWVTIDAGREYIRLTGIVRPEDIDASNVISSQRVADARITYSGNGMTANASRGGLLTQLLYKFFPY